MIGEIEGIKIYVNDGTYTKYKKTLEDEIDELQQENQELNQKYLNAVTDYETTMSELQELKKQLEEYKATNEVLSHELTKDKVLQQDCLTTCCGIPIGDIPKLITQQKEFIEYLENEKDRLARECSNIYEDSLGHTRLVNEDKFNEVNDILQKYKSIIRDDK